MRAVNVSTSTVIEGGKNFEASKSGWYYDYTNKGTKDSINGRLYWVIEVSGNEIPKGTVFRDVPSTSKGSKHQMRRESMVNGGVFVGKIPNGKSFTEYYGSNSDVKSDSAMRKLSGNELNGVAAPANADYSGERQMKQADFTSKKRFLSKRENACISFSGQDLFIRSAIEMHVHFGMNCIRRTVPLLILYRTAIPV